MTTCFFSGSTGSDSVIERNIDICQHRLLSCHAQYFPVAKRWLSRAYRHPLAKQREIMLDSGAFSAWSKGSEAHLDDVIAKYDTLFNRYAPYYKEIWMINLDKIPGEKGRTATVSEMDEAIKISDRNFEILTKRFGNRVLPVFHQDESVERLKEVVQQNPNYICISPRNDVHEKSRREWSQRAHAALETHVNTHGLAATGVKMMTQVPWRSVDSGSWMQVAAYGKVFLCMHGSMFVNAISSDSPTLRDIEGHVENYPSLARDACMAAIAETGVPYEKARADFSERSYINLYHFHKFLNLPASSTPTSLQPTLFTL